MPWLVGAVAAHGAARTWFWASALAVDYVGFRLAYPVPGLGPVPEARRNVTAEHLAERHQQFFTIALGDAVLVSGTLFSLHHSGVRLRRRHAGAGRSGRGRPPAQPGSPAGGAGATAPSHRAGNRNRPYRDRDAVWRITRAGYMPSTSNPPQPRGGN
ncbi:hypothetical protein GCM10027186_25570 [Micromonospora schwarzwaldensis]